MGTSNAFTREHDEGSPKAEAVSQWMRSKPVLVHTLEVTVNDGCVQSMANGLVNIATTSHSCQKRVPITPSQFVSTTNLYLSWDAVAPR
ncbi:hypothetical protein OSTOST_00035 [Ostertagia ostertagi]